MESDYDAHSEYQRRVIEGGDRLIRALAGELDLAAPRDALAVADYGAGTGATSVHAVRTAIEAVRARDADVPVLAIHNDLPTIRLLAPVPHRRGTRRLPGAAAAARCSRRRRPDRSSTRSCPTPASTPACARTPPTGCASSRTCACPRACTSPTPPAPRGAALADQAAGDWRAFLTARAAELRPGGRLLVQGIGLDRRRRVGGEAADRDVAGGGRAWPRTASSTARRSTTTSSPSTAASPEEVSAVPPGLDGRVGDQRRGGQPVLGAVRARPATRAAYAKTYTEFVRAFAASSLTTRPVRRVGGPVRRVLRPPRSAPPRPTRPRAATSAGSSGRCSRRRPERGPRRLRTGRPGCGRR